MARLILKLKKLENGSQDLIVDYESDSDAMAFEHEEEHAALVQELLGSLSEAELQELGAFISREQVTADKQEKIDQGEREERLKA